MDFPFLLTHRQLSSTDHRIMRISIFIEYSSSSSATLYRPILILYIFWFLSNRQPFLRQITFLDTCQKTVSTHAPQFRSNLFYSEITLIHDYSFVPTLQSALRAVPCILCTQHAPVQPGKTLLCPWPFAFHPHRFNAMVHFPSFRLIHHFGLSS